VARIKKTDDANERRTAQYFSSRVEFVMPANSAMSSTLARVTVRRISCWMYACRTDAPAPLK
jgi:hypothetical protein